MNKKHSLASRLKKKVARLETSENGGTLEFDEFDPQTGEKLKTHKTEFTQKGLEGMIAAFPSQEKHLVQRIEAARSNYEMRKQEIEDAKLLLESILKAKTKKKAESKTKK